MSTLIISRSIATKLGGDCVEEQDYQLASHIELWPYWFVVMFSIFSIATHGDKVVPKLTEGITLLQSIAVTYWVIDYGFINTPSYFVKTLMGMGIMCSLYSVFSCVYLYYVDKGRPAHVEPLELNEE